MSGPVVLFGVLIVCMLFGIPISWSLCLSSFAAFLCQGDLPISIITQRLFIGADSFSMLAVPAFIVAGEIMSRGGISKRLIDFANVIVGRISGGLAMVSIVASTFFAALSGSAIATTAAIGGIMYPEMEKRNYPKDFSAAVQAIGGTLGPIIPPSILFIMYGNATGLSVGKLLLSGVMPGLISCIFLCGVCYITAKRNHFPKVDTRFSVKEVLKAGKSALCALLMPVIILGGIYSGVFTPTESAGIAVIYGIIVSFFVYKEMTPRDLLEVIKSSAISTGNLMILVMGAQLFGWFVAYFNIPKAVANSIHSISSSPVVFLLIVLIVLLIAGMFMEAMAIVLILAPIMAPMAVSFGIDPIHFAAYMVFVLCIGIATPPFGPTLYVACGISKQPFVNVAKKLMPFIGIQIMLALILAFVPQISTWLPNLM